MSMNRGGSHVLPTHPRIPLHMIRLFLHPGQYRTEGCWQIGMTSGVTS